MPILSKEELLKKAIEYKNYVNKCAGEGTYTISDEQIKNNVDKKYDIYSKCVEFCDQYNEKTNKLSKLREEYHQESPFRGVDASWISLSDTTDSENQNKEIVKNLFGNDPTKNSNEQFIKYHEEIYNNLDISELYEAGKSVESSLEYAKNHEAAVVGVFAVKSISEEVINNVKLTIPTSKNFDDSVKNWGNVIENAKLAHQKIIANTSPFAFLYDDVDVNLDKDFSNKIGKCLLNINPDIKFQTEFTKNATNFEKGFSSEGKETFLANADYLKKNNIHKNFMNFKITTDKDNLIQSHESLSKEEIESVKSVKTLNEYTAKEATQFMSEKLVSYNANFPSEKNGYRSITNVEIKQIADSLYHLSNCHFSRNKPSWWEFIVRTKAAKEYSAERSLMNKYSELLKKIGVKKETIDKLVDRRNREPINSKDLPSISNNLRNRFKDAKEEYEKNIKNKDNNLKENNVKNSLIIDEALDKNIINVDKNNLPTASKTNVKSKEKEKPEILK